MVIPRLEALGHAAPPGAQPPGDVIPGTGWDFPWPEGSNLGGRGRTEKIHRAQKKRQISTIPSTGLICSSRCRTNHSPPWNGCLEPTPATFLSTAQRGSFPDRPLLDAVLHGRGRATVVTQTEKEHSQVEGQSHDGYTCGRRRKEARVEMVTHRRGRVIGEITCYPYYLLLAHVIYFMPNTVLRSSPLLTHETPPSIPMIYFYFHFAEEEQASEKLSHLPTVTQLPQRQPRFTPPGSLVAGSVLSALGYLACQGGWGDL